MGCVVLPNAPSGVGNFLLQQEWEHEKELYREQFTVVHHIIHIKHGYKAALKLYEKNEVTDKRFKYIETEIKVHRLLSTDPSITGIVPLWLYYEDNKYYGLLMKYMNQGTLTHFLYRYHHEACALQEVIYPLLTQLKVLHDKHIIHRDIKPDNIFVHHRTIYIGDFGYAYQVEEHRANSIIGTIQYMAPELLQCYLDRSKTIVYSYEVDVWSFGMIVYEMLFHRKPFGWGGYKNVCLENPTQPEFIQRCLEAPLVFPHYITPEAQDFLEKTLQKDPRQRATTKQLLEHPWITTYLKSKKHEEVCPIQLDWIRQTKTASHSTKNPKKNKSKNHCTIS